MRFVLLILLVACFSFFSYGQNSSDPVQYSYQIPKWESHSSRVSKSIHTIKKIPGTASYLSNFSDFKLNAVQEQLSTFKINFQNIDFNTGSVIIPANKSNFKITAINLHDSSISKQPTVPYLRNEHAGIWKKIGRAELFIGGVEVVGMTVLILLPKEVTKWSNHWAQDAMRNLKRSFTNLPVWDKDDWQLNYIGHPIAGSYYYNALRSQNASRFHSFLFSTAQSFIWEYFIEGMAEKPSAQDLFVTPVVGSLLGETTHQLTMSMRRNGFNFFEKVFVLLFNPMFVINNGFGKRFNPAFAKR
jgi:Domain of unknown function (DUF3943)